ncbi:hypothetical protein AEGHOMDF_3540 [Methylobacterium soli]|nr:hypothetical protein AEGHOMDF_3540 [Methylobacterium soli]
MSPCRVYWYWAKLWRPPIRRSWRGNRNSRAPATWASFGRRRFITSVIDGRSPRGFSPTKTLAELVPRPPVKPTTLSTAGSACTMAVAWRSFCSIAWKEMRWSAWMPPIICPVSCSGKKPFGTMT